MKEKSIINIIYLQTRRFVMKKNFRKAMAIVLSLAMVVTTFAFSSAKVDAATLTQDEIDSIAGNGTMTNMVLNSAATAYPGVAEGNVANLTNGNFSGHCALSSGWGYSGEAYAILDLGNIYKSESLDEIVCAYKDYADNDTVVGRTYNIQYSDDLANWDTVYTSGTIAAADLEDSKATVNDVSNITGRVRYIKIDYPTLPTYGIQLTEIAVLAADPELAPVETCADPAAVTASSNALGQITFNITAGEDQEGYVYSANLDSPNGQLLNATCQAGVDYTYDVVGGNHTVFVQSHYNGAISPGIYSNQVTVNTYATKVTDPDWNYAYGKDVTLSSGTSTEPVDAPSNRVTDGVIADNNYVTSDKGAAGSWFTIDLVDTWKATSFETLAVWFRSNVGGTYPEQGGMKFQYSTDGVDFMDVATLTQADFSAQKGSQVNPFLITGDVSGLSTGAVRYVRVYFPNSVAYGAQITEIGVYDVDGDAELAPVETVDDPAGFTAESDDYNEITGTITPATGQVEDGYTWNVYLDGDLAAEGLTGGDYRLDGVEAGSYDVTVKSYKDGFLSSGLTVADVAVSDGFVYSSETGTGVYDDTNTNGTNLITQNGATVSGVTATASNGNATNAIDYNAGTRWEASSSDPQWLCVDLGAVKTIKEVDAWWETASARDFKVQVSTDGTNFKTVGIVNGAASGANRRDTIVLTNAVSGRYVRIYDTARTTNWGHSIFEMAVYDGQVIPEGYYNVADYKSTTPYTYPTKEGKIFAGWFTDDTCTEAYTETTGYAYAKFIDAKALTVKFQKHQTAQAIRFVSTIDDNLNYQQVGFEFNGTYGNGDNPKVIPTTTKTTGSVYTKITAGGESIVPSEAFENDDSSYFFTYTVRGMNGTTGSHWEVTPFYVTPDGTKVMGQEATHDMVPN